MKDNHAFYHLAFQFCKKETETTVIEDLQTIFPNFSSLQTEH